MQMKEELLGRRSVLVATAVVMLVVAGVVTARSERSAEPPTSTRDALEAAVAQRPHLPVLVPENWHDDWAALDVSGSVNAGPAVLVATYRIAPKHALRHPGLALCVVAPELEEVLATEYDANPESVDSTRVCAATVGSDDVVDTTSVGNLRAVLLRIGRQPVPATWLTIPMTSDWRRVSWLDAVEQGEDNDDDVSLQEFVDDPSGHLATHLYAANDIAAQVYDIP